MVDLEENSAKGGWTVEYTCIAIWNYDINFISTILHLKILLVLIVKQIPYFFKNFVFWFLVVFKKKSPCIVQKDYVTCLEIYFVRLLLQRNADLAPAYRTHSPRLNVSFPSFVLQLQTNASFEHLWDNIWFRTYYLHTKNWHLQLLPSLKKKLDCFTRTSFFQNFYFCYFCFSENS